MPTRHILGAAVLMLLLALFAGIGVVLLRRDDAPLAAIEISKGRRELRLVDSAGRTLRKFPVALGPNPAALKRVEGDGATPEGEYFVCVKNPASKFHLSLGLSYPGPADAERGCAEGLISGDEARAIHEAHARGETPPWKTALGGEIFIHGGGAGPDWTLGCVALDNAAMRELYERVPLGLPVRITP